MSPAVGRRWWLYGVMDRDPVARPALADPEGKSLAGTHPALADLMRRVHARHRTEVNSARRHLADQQLFWECAQTRKKTGKCPPECNRSQCASANRPGQSNHEFGLAVDAGPLDGRVGAWQAVVVQEGGHFVIADEPWHVQLKATTSGKFTSYPDGWRAD